ncbi:probable membrane-associated kinase regulator 4 [Juglans microcarpa x Juglans regia]|uniref:probable membrane-associated kinase regulator 4 n=1 Tax=Juglans microcarpa x Juglans regia TaxID=2249226 RepID=UPI001B7DC30D|nr:probable membrane-associated kinase regulator 4 [Juglans microcarpa x Juglans regia]
MAVNLQSCDHADDDYIDMEVSSYSNFLCHSVGSPPHTREFEFQMSSSSQEREPTTSPADELFYKGKLLPLHLPPRLQMVEKLLQNSSPAYDTRKDIFEEFYSTPLTTTAPTPTSSTPFESCNISPSESCRVSRELNLDEYISEYSTELSGFYSETQRKSWTKKLKQSSLGLKLKASRAYLKSLFSKSGCSHESCTAATKNADEGSVSKAKECMNTYMKESKKIPFGQIQKDKCSTSTSIMKSIDEDKTTENGFGHHRRSFSVIIKRHSAKKYSPPSSSSSSSSSSNSNDSKGFHELQFLKRRGSASSDIEVSIQGAIAHCKQSQQLFHSRKTASEVGFYSLSTSRIAVREDQEGPDLCRG